MESNAQVLVVCTVIGQLIALLTIMFNARQARRREERKRKWELEDRAAMAKGLHSAIQDNTHKTEQAIVAADLAYKEANHVNLKLQALGLENQQALADAAKPRAAT